jgi:hypothetical protein
MTSSSMQGQAPGQAARQAQHEGLGLPPGDPKGDYAEVMEAEAREKGMIDPREIANYVWGDFNETCSSTCCRTGAPT